MKTLFLHIGMPKTGTSAVQYFLEINSDELKNQGFMYERMPYVYQGHHSRRNAHFLIGMVYDEEGKKDEKAKAARVDEGLNIVKEWFTKFDQVLLTEEQLWNFFGRHGFKVLGRVSKFCRENGFTLKVVVYLRRQDDWLVSTYRQKVRGGSEQATLIEYFDDPSEISLNYDEILSGIEKKIGKENIILRKYDFSEFKGGKIELDFLDALGLSTTEDYVFADEQINTSYPMNFIEMKRIINRLDGEGNTTSHTDVSLLWEHNLIRMREFIADYREEILSDDMRADIMGRYAEGNRSVAERYLPEGEVLFSEKKKGLSDADVWKSDNDRRYEDTVLFFADIITEQQKKMSRLYERQKRIEEKYNERLDKYKDAINTLQREIDSLETKYRLLNDSTDTLWRRIRYGIKWRLRKIFKKGN